MSGWLLMALCAATGTSCLSRMRGCRGPAREAAGGEALMAFGMAAMAVPTALLPLPAWHWVVYAAVFGAAAVRAVWPARHGCRHLHHAVGCAAMVYMGAAMAPAGGHDGHAGAGVPLLTGALLVYFAGYVLRAGTRLVPLAAAGGGGTLAAQPSSGPRPELVPACRVSMGIAMLAMLLAL